MQNQNTRRGNTQKSNNAVVYKNGHSRGILSGIYHACRCKNKENTLLNRYVEDPRQHSSGMTPSFDNGLTAWGFTLIELLVVVVIIGILAAVAVPKYQLAVAKSRVSAYLPLVKSMANANEVYYMENGHYAVSSYTQNLGIRMPAECRYNGNNTYTCGTDFLLNFSNQSGLYLHYCPGNSFHYTNCMEHNNCNIEYYYAYGSTPRKKQLTCAAKTPLGTKICNSLNLN